MPILLYGCLPVLPFLQRNTSSSELPNGDPGILLVLVLTFQLWHHVCMVYKADGSQLILDILLIKGKEHQYGDEDTANGYVGAKDMLHGINGSRRNIAEIFSCCSDGVLTLPWGNEKKRNLVYRLPILINANDTVLGGLFDNKLPNRTQKPMPKSIQAKDPSGYTKLSIEKT